MIISPDTNLLWVDCEFTGLSLKDDLLLEVAAVATDASMNELDSYHTFIHQPEASVLKRMNQDNWWSDRPKHRRSMLAAIAGTTATLAETDISLSEFAGSYCSQPVILAGNTIRTDRQFIDRDLPLLANMLHYRELDVSSIKIIAAHRGIAFPKRNLHEAQTDVQESIEELVFLLRSLGNLHLLNSIRQPR